MEENFRRIRILGGMIVSNGLKEIELNKRLNFK